MSDDEQLRANLELPKLFGRKRKKAAPESEEASPEPEDTGAEPETAEPEPEPEAVPEAEAAPEAEAVAAAPEPTIDDESADADPDDAAVAPPPAEPEQLSDPPPAVSEPPEPVPSAAEAEEEAEVEPSPETVAAEPEAPAGPEPVAEPEADVVPPPVTERPTPGAGSTSAAEEPGSVATERESTEPDEADEPAGRKRAGVLSGAASRMRDSAQALPMPGLPALEGYRAAAVTGALIGLLLVGVTAGTMQACGLVRGADTCGRSGIFLLAAIFVLMVIGSTALLRAWHVREPGSTALLALGVVAVVALLLLIDLLFSVWMVVVIPIVSAGAFAMSFWVTDNFADEPPGD